jgi:hypothetical protein
MSIDLAKSRIQRHMEQMAVTPDLHDQKHGLVDQKRPEAFRSKRKHRTWPRLQATNV